MIWLVGGVLLWMGAHLFKRLFPATRAALGRAGRFIVLAAIVASIALMIVGYLEADQTFLYALPPWAWYANNALMWVALFLMDVGQARGVIRTRIRHPMLAGVAVWAVAHLLVNGDVPSLVLFGGLGLWALVEMAVISRAEGPWQPPERGRWIGDAKVALLASALYALIVGIHHWLDRPVLLFL
jgi:uncharacterized membrane protein